MITYKSNKKVFIVGCVQRIVFVVSKAASNFTNNSTFQLKQFLLYFLSYDLILGMTISMINNK